MKAAFIWHISLGAKTETAPRGGMGRHRVCCCLRSLPQSDCGHPEGPAALLRIWIGKREGVPALWSRPAFPLLLSTTCIRFSCLLWLLYTSGHAVLLVHDIISCSIKVVASVLAFYTRFLRGQTNMFSVWWKRRLRSLAAGPSGIMVVLERKPQVFERMKPGCRKALPGSQPCQSAFPEQYISFSTPFLLNSYNNFCTSVCPMQNCGLSYLRSITNMSRPI